MDMMEDRDKFFEWLRRNGWFSFTDGKWNYTFEHGTSISDEEYEKNYRKTTRELMEAFQMEQANTGNEKAQN